MKCSKCAEKSVIDKPALCKIHFLKYFEDKVVQTIKEQKLLDKKDRVCVAVSGGKDSVSLLFLLKKLGYNVEALAIDEGILGYRDETLDFLKEFCKQNKIKLVIKSFEKEVGKKLDSMIGKGPACNKCGTFRRHLLNKHAEKYDKIATGHNLDDESQAVLMNILNAQTKLFSRQGPKTVKKEGFVQKIKPFYFMKEKEIMIYSILNGFNVPFTECPYSTQSFRFFVRSELNKLELEKPGAKENILKHYLSLRYQNEVAESLDKCGICGSPCTKNICKACKIKKEFII